MGRAQLSRLAGVFFKGSYAISDQWKEGSRVLFLGPDESGIYSIIETHIPNKIIKFKYLGKVINGKEQPMDEESKAWSGATEAYKIIEGPEVNTLQVEIDVMEEHVELMTATFPKALERVKQKCS